MMDELKIAQIRIGQALEGAQLEQDKEIAQTVRELGESLARGIQGLVKLTRMHAADNAAFDTPVRDVAATLQRLHALLGVTHLVCVEGLVYVNDVRVRVDERAAAELGEDLERHGCGGLIFDEPLDALQVRALTDLIGAAPAGADPLRPFEGIVLDARGPLERLRDALRDTGLDGVYASGPHRFALTAGMDEAPPADPRAAVRAAAEAVAVCFDNLAAGRLPNSVPVRRAVIGLVDGGQEALVASAEVDPMLPAHARHAVRVTCLAVRLALDVGFSDAALADLGVAAMLHDMGYADRSDGLAPSVALHGVGTARLLLRQRGFHQARLKRLLAAIEHHRDYAAEPRPHLYARILRIADDYDTLTCERRPAPLATPPQALGRMRAAVGTAYDPTLFQVFLNAMGPFPPGTRLRLADGRVVVVVDGARGAARFGKPLCRVVRFADGRAPAEPTPVDLAVEGRVIGIG